MCKDCYFCASCVWFVGDKHPVYFVVYATGSEKDAVSFIYRFLTCLLFPLALHYSVLFRSTAILIYHIHCVATLSVIFLRFSANIVCCVNFLAYLLNFLIRILKHLMNQISINVGLYKFAQIIAFV